MWMLKFYCNSFAEQTNINLAPKMSQFFVCAEIGMCSPNSCEREISFFHILVRAESLI